MKKYFLLIIAVSLIAFQACKKDNELTDPNRTAKTYKTDAKTSSFSSQSVENMDSYLSNFLKEIKSPTRDSQPLSVEDAQWHISACLNYLYCDAGVNKTQIIYDTVYSNIVVIDDCVTMEEINNSIQTISKELGMIYMNSVLENKNVLYINSEILEETTRSGSTVRTVIAMSDNVIGGYYFDNDSIPLSFFPEDATYLWNTEAIDTLTHYMYMYKPERPLQSDRMFFTNITTITCTCLTHTRRLFNTLLSYHYRLNNEEMAYFLDSYLGLIKEARPEHLDYISFLLKPINGDLTSDMCAPMLYHHILDINYGRMTFTGTNPIIPEN